MQLSRVCPGCQKNIIYKTPRTHSVALKKNTLCRSCLFKGERSPAGEHKQYSILLIV